jgi:hypothetical protein
MEKVIKMNTMFRIAVKLQAPAVISLGICPRDSLATSSHFSQTTPPVNPSHPVPVPASTPPPVAPNKLEMNTIMDLKKLTNKSIPALAKSQDIQGWYNV